jgi:polysaccharide biosynthesis/export protein
MKKLLNVFFILISAAAPLCLTSTLTGCSTKKSAPIFEPVNELSPEAALLDSTNSGTQFTPWKKTTPNLIAPGFEIEVSSTADKKIKGIYRVDMDGLLKLPYQVEVSASGNTLNQLTGAINRAYGRLLVSPQIKVSVITDAYYVEVGGLVVEPGVFAVPKSASLDELIAKAKGLQHGSDQSARAQYARITQGKITNTIRLQDYYSGLPGLQPTWAGGEKVFLQYTHEALVPRSSSSYIRMVGQIKNPGEYRFQDGKDVYDYMILAGGPTERANLDNVRLIRGVDQGSKATIAFSLNEGDTIPPLASGDVVMFQAENPTQLEKNSRTWGGFASIFSSIAGLVALIGLSL